MNPNNWQIKPASLSLALLLFLFLGSSFCRAQGETTIKKRFSSLYIQTKIFQEGILERSACSHDEFPEGAYFKGIFIRPISEIELESVKLLELKKAGNSLIVNGLEEIRMCSHVQSAPARQDFFLVGITSNEDILFLSGKILLNSLRSLNANDPLLIAKIRLYFLLPEDISLKKETSEEWVFQAFSKIEKQKVFIGIMKVDPDVFKIWLKGNKRNPIQETFPVSDI